MPKLTERRQLQTRSDIASAAVALFLDRGFDETTMADVAEAADVSRRTVYRYYPTKDDLVFEYPSRWLAQFKAEMAKRQPDEPFRDLSRRVLLSIAATIGRDAEDVLAAFSVLQTTDSLRGKHGRTDDLWVAHYVELIAAEPGFLPEHLTEVMVAVTATVAGTNTSIALWSMGQPEAELEPIIIQILDQLDPIWPDWLC